MRLYWWETSSSLRRTGEVSKPEINNNDQQTITNLQDKIKELENKLNTRTNHHQKVIKLVNDYKEKQSIN